MKKNRYLLIILISFLLLNSCSDDDDDAIQTCPQTEIASMKINGELKQFEINGRGIDLDNDGSGHTLSLWLFTGVFQPQQDSYAVTIELPYKKTGTNIIEGFNYFRVQNATSTEGDFVEGEFKSKVIVNTNSCFSASFSGHAIIDGNEIVITEGIVKHVYDEPFD
ncbi:hypothetical protein [uncultured Lacinutrix sp.]|uniref:hypothetical protein n=1 Tax=uncultured Lacinutrix sp. TaxID=574032 RepID=UPI00261197E6|nr:hypothetical protein [uncultured Lacinutrix sp.]